MSPSPQPEQEVDQQEQTPEDNDPNAEKDMNRPEDDPNFGYDFEVKEQDRWLPIANGECDCIIPSLSHTFYHPVVCVPFNVCIFPLPWLPCVCPALPCLHCTAHSPLLYHQRSAPCLDSFIPLSLSVHLTNVSHYRFRSFHPPHKPFLFAASTDCIHFVESELLLSANSAVSCKHRAILYSVDLSRISTTYT